MSEPIFTCARQKLGIDQPLQDSVAARPQKKRKWGFKSWEEEVAMNVEQLLKTKGAKVTIIGPETTIEATARLLAERNKGLALVCDAGEQLLGVVSVIDISRAVGEFAERAPTMAVETIMTADFAFCRLEDSLEDVLQKMTERSIRHLPVVQDGVLKGLLNMRGVLETRFEEAEIRADEMRKYVFGVGYH